MPVRIVKDDENEYETETDEVETTEPEVAPEYVEPAEEETIDLTYNVVTVEFSADAPFFASGTRIQYDAYQAPDHADEIDFAYFYSQSTGHNIVSPATLTRPEYREFQIDWGYLAPEFRWTNVSFEEIDVNQTDMNPQWLFDLFEASEPTRVPSQAPGARFNSHDDTLTPGRVLVYSVDQTNTLGFIIVVEVGDETATLIIGCYIFSEGC